MILAIVLAQSCCTAGSIKDIQKGPSFEALLSIHAGMQGGRNMAPELPKQYFYKAPIWKDGDKKWSKIGILGLL